MATIRDPNPIKLGEFHTVELNRNNTLGYVIVDGGEPINGSSQVRQSESNSLTECYDQFVKSSLLLHRESSRAWI